MAEVTWTDVPVFGHQGALLPTATGCFGGGFFYNPSKNKCEFMKKRRQKDDGTDTVIRCTFKPLLWCDVVVFTCHGVCRRIYIYFRSLMRKRLWYWYLNKYFWIHSLWIWLSSITITILMFWNKYLYIYLNSWIVPVNALILKITLSSIPGRHISGATFNISKKNVFMRFEERKRSGQMCHCLMGKGQAGPDQKNSQLAKVKAQKSIKQIHHISQIRNN